MFVWLHEILVLEVEFYLLKNQLFSREAWTVCKVADSLHVKQKREECEDRIIRFEVHVLACYSLRCYSHSRDIGRKERELGELVLLAPKP